MPASEPAAPVLDVSEVSVRFGGVQALDRVNLSVPAGDVTGLIGPNGAGKTTLFNVITGLERPATGTVKLDGQDLDGLATYRRARLGMARTFQRLEIFGSLTAYENVLAAAEFRQGWEHDGADPAQLAHDILDRVGISGIADARVDALPTGQARLVELGRALATRPKLILLDEPGSGLSQQETLALGDLLLALASDGTAILLVEHDVELVIRVSTQIYVLDFGKLIASGTPKQIQSNKAVQAAYLGADTSDLEAAS